MPQLKSRDELLNRINKRKRHFVRKRKYAKAFDDADMPDMAQALRDCEETQILVGCQHCGKSWYVTNRCRKRVCPLCSYRVAKERANFLKAMSAHMKFPKFLTLTMPLWQDVPQDGIKFLRECFSKLRRHKLFEKVVGGAYQIEVKIKDTGYHIHMHIMMDCPYLPYQQVFSAWKKLVGHECPQIFIEAMKTEKAKEYVCKYASKASDFDSSPDVVVEWHKAVKGQRLFTTFGKWYNAKIEDLDAEFEVFKPVAECPFCKEIGTSFLVRDGPFVFGNENWEVMRVSFCAEGDEIKIIPEIKNAIDHACLDPNLELDLVEN